MLSSFNLNLVPSCGRVLSSRVPQPHLIVSILGLNQLDLMFWHPHHELQRGHGATTHYSLSLTRVAGLPHTIS